MIGKAFGSLLLKRKLPRALGCTCPTLMVRPCSCATAFSPGVLSKLSSTGKKWNCTSGRPWLLVSIKPPPSKILDVNKPERVKRHL